MSATIESVIRIMQGAGAAPEPDGGAPDDAAPRDAGPLVLIDGPFTETKEFVAG